MTRTARPFAVALVAAVALAVAAQARDIKRAPASGSAGTVDLKSAGPLAVGPNGVLFVADPQGATVFAIETGDKLRYPVGQDANLIVTARKAMTDEQFESTMRQQLGLTW